MNYIINKIDQVDGLYYIKLPDSYDHLITELDKLEWKPLSKSPHSRKVQHYGYMYDYNSYKIDTKTDDIPPFLTPLQTLLHDISKRLDLIDDTYIYNQCIVNNYEVGQGISKHIDVKAYGPFIGCYTLGSGATMRFRKNSVYHDLYVEANSLYIMSSHARYTWTHEMLPTKYDGDIKRGRRVSVTFRHV